MCMPVRARLGCRWTLRVAARDAKASAAAAATAAAHPCQRPRHTIEGWSCVYAVYKRARTRLKNNTIRATSACAFFYSPDSPMSDAHFLRARLFTCITERQEGEVLRGLKEGEWGGSTPRGIWIFMGEIVFRAFDSLAFLSDSRSSFLLSRNRVQREMDFFLCWMPKGRCRGEEYGRGCKARSR